MSARVLISERVAAALAQRRPVVALETTVVTHGLPAPLGVEVALEMERAVKERGAVPATIGVLEGAVHVGMTREQLERLAGAPDTAKLNLGNFGAELASGRSGSSTVAVTVFMAARTGIPVFATGGIGGVHRDVAESGDVSADLTALARWPVAVVCAGAKAILDLKRTRELLETLGVPLLGYRTDELPAFYRRASGIPVDRRCDDVAELAEAVRAHWTLGFQSGVVIGNPIPMAHELPAEVYEPALSQALAEAAAQSVSGRAVTPFLLERIRALTGGASVAANRALLVENARLAADLAGELARA